MEYAYLQQFEEQADIISKVGNNVPNKGAALMDAVECNEHTGLSVLIVDEKGKGVYFIDADGCGWF